MTIEEGQAKREQGYWLVVTRNYKKVILSTKSEKDALAIYSLNKYNRGGAKIYGPLKKVVNDVKKIEAITKEMRAAGICC